MYQVQTDHGKVMFSGTKKECVRYLIKFIQNVDYYNLINSTTGRAESFILDENLV
jgi:hypothetical protein